MEMSKADAFFVLFLLVVLTFVAISVFIFGPDNIVEQSIERGIHQHTGFEIDFTPQNLFPGISL
jgi:hypothetical protein